MTSTDPNSSNYSGRHGRPPMQDLINAGIIPHDYQGDVVIPVPRADIERVLSERVLGATVSTDTDMV